MLPLIIGVGCVSILSLYYLPKRILLYGMNKFYPEILMKKNTKYIYITIDDVPYSYNSIKNIINYLDSENIKATFFVIKPKYDSCQQILIDAIKNGHHLANHGTTDTMHATKDVSIIRREISDCNSYLDFLYYKADVKRPTTKYYRPGCGFFTRNLLNLCYEAEHTMALGTIYPHDPQIKSSMLNFHYIKSKLEKGDIIVIHDRDHTLSLLKMLVPYIKEKGFVCKTL